MRALGIEGDRLLRGHRTTVSDPAAHEAPDLIGRDFTATAPNTKDVGDITYEDVGPLVVLVVTVATARKFLSRLTVRSTSLRRR